jgi:dTDP-4-amino-4,6-dideoxygalactose transaminase
MAELEAAANRVMRSGHYILGEEVTRFEAELADYCGVKHAVTCANGTDALELALRAVGVKVGDSVLVPAFTFAATASAVCAVGARPTFADIYLDSFSMHWPNPGCGCSDCWVPVHLYGRWYGEMAPIGERVIEDMAQGIGLPVTGDAACLSFFPTKNLGCMGDGGAVLTNRDDVAEKVRLLRSHGSRTKYHHECVGRNSRLDAIQAAILSVKLQTLPLWNYERQELAEHYGDGLGGVEGVTLPSWGVRHMWNQYTVRIGNGRRDAVQATLAAAGVETMVYYPEPLHLQPAFACLGYKRGDFPEAERACEEVLSLPIYPGLTDAEQDYVIEALKRALDGRLT